jgi:hypothetical protein
MWMQLINLLTKAFRVRTILGVIIAPLVPGLLMAGFTLQSEPHLAIWYIKLSAAIGYTVAIPFGIPLYLLMVKKRWTSLPSYLIMGSILGIIAFLLLVIPSLVFAPEGIYTLGPWTFPFSVLSIVFGLLAGLTFWLIAAPYKD